MNEAIRIAIEKGGYSNERLTVVRGDIFTFGEKFHHRELENMVVLDPLFWQALAKALGKEWFDGEQLPIWLYWGQEYNRLVLTGGDTEQFFKDLLTP